MNNAVAAYRSQTAVGGPGPARLIGRPARGRKTRRGQTVLVALLALLLLAFVSAVFVAIVTHNFRNAGRQNRLLTADYSAQIGIRYADDQLLRSPEGADWRPPLQFQLASAYQPAAGTREAARYAAAAASLAPVNLRDPDRIFLQQGFTRYNTGNGRFLLRVTYDPVGAFGATDNGCTPGQPCTNPLARYLKIESVGREGVVDASDPTTFTLRASRLSATQVAYKAIGITDWGRFETNPDRRSDVMSLGTAGFFSSAANDILTPGVFEPDTKSGDPPLQQFGITTTYGAPDAYLKNNSTGQLIPNPRAGSGQTIGGYTNVAGGGSIAAGGSVRFYGKNLIYLNRYNTGTGTPAYNDGVAIAGSILLENYSPSTTGVTDLTKQDARLTAAVDPGTGTAAAADIFPSKDTNFDTDGGAVRDGTPGNDAAGNPRSVNRLDPPLIDTADPATNLPRYRDLALHSSPRTGVTDPNAAQDGYGQVIYVSNTSDVQNESLQLTGGRTLVDEWLNRTPPAASNVKFGWIGPFYNAPGLNITLGRQVAAGSSGTVSFYGLRLTRSDLGGDGATPVQWKSPDGASQIGTTLLVSYDSLNASNDPATVTATTPNPNNDVTLYAEGNIIVHGIASADSAGSDPATTAGAADDELPRHILLVTNGTAYIDGNLLKGSPDSSITILAHDYVCVNTTQFLAGPQADGNPTGTQPPSASVDPDKAALEFTPNNDLLLQEVNWGLPNGATPSGQYGASPLALYLSAGPDEPPGAELEFDIVNPATGLGVQSGQNPFTGTTTGSPGSPSPNPALPHALSLNPAADGTAPGTFIHTTYDLSGVAALTGSVESDVRQLWMRRHPVPSDPTNTKNVLLERVAVLPMDIRIEAVLYAQTRSFFIIPGQWFNTDGSDTVDRWSSRAVPDNNASRFPFYGQPLDLKITIDGAVAEARPAEIGAQTAWMQKWGWIPHFHGSLLTSPAEASGHQPVSGTGPGVGLSIVYNPQAAYPYAIDPSNPNTLAKRYYLRSDTFGRPLPFSPDLPVCSGLLYSGENPGPSLLQ